MHLEFDSETEASPFVPQTLLQTDHSGAYTKAGHVHLNCLCRI